MILRDKVLQFVFTTVDWLVLYSGTDGSGLILQLLELFQLAKLAVWIVDMFSVKIIWVILDQKLKSITREDCDLHNLSTCTGDIPVCDLSVGTSFSGVTVPLLVRSAAWCRVFLGCPHQEELCQGEGAIGETGCRSPGAGKPKPVFFHT